MFFRVETDQVWIGRTKLEIQKSWKGLKRNVFYVGMLNLSTANSISNPNTDRSGLKKCQLD